MKRPSDFIALVSQRFSLTYKHLNSNCFNSKRRYQLWVQLHESKGTRRHDISHLPFFFNKKQSLPCFLCSWVKVNAYVSVWLTSLQWMVSLHKMTKFFAWYNREKFLTASDRYRNLYFAASNLWKVLKLWILFVMYFIQKTQTITRWNPTHSFSVFVISRSENKFHKVSKENSYWYIAEKCVTKFTQKAIHSRWTW